MNFDTASDLAARVRTGKILAIDVAQAAIARIDALDGPINAFTDRTFNRALMSAAAIDRKVRAGIDPGPMAGVPFAVKNLFDIEGLVTRAGSKIRRTCQPAVQDATLVAKWTDAGGILLGALNMDEFAYGFTTENAHDGPTRNPHDLTRMSGGSSGGSAAAVAAGMVPITAGSDTNGSIRVPAAFCGVFGLKPTYGRLSRRGAFPFVHSFDHVGPFARTIGDLALAYNTAQGDDPNDPVQSRRAEEPIVLADTPSIGDLRIGILDDWFQTNAWPEAISAVGTIARALQAERQVTLARADLARASAFIISGAEGAMQHLGDLRRRPQDFDPATRDRLLAGGLLPASLILKAQRFRTWFRAQVAEVFKSVDVVLAPATPLSAPALGQTSMRLGDKDVLVRPNIGLYTQPLSFIGLPVLVVPVCAPGAMPMGVQIIAAPWREDLLFQTAHYLERLGITQAVIPKSVGSPSSQNRID